MKKDMQALAQAQFGEANKKYNAMKVLLFCSLQYTCLFILLVLCRHTTVPLVRGTYIAVTTMTTMLLLILIRKILVKRRNYLRYHEYS